MKQNDDNIKKLYKAIIALESEKECSDFFYDLCTIQELQAMSQRLEVAKMLTRNLVYSEISEKTGASTATISRVNRSLSYGKGGYSAIIKRLKDEL